MQLVIILRWLIAGGGAGSASFWIVNRISWPVNYPSEHKRYFAMAIAAAIAMAAFAFSVLVTYTIAPVTPLGWLENLVSVGFAAAASITLVHGAVDLHAQDKKVEAARRDAADQGNSCDPDYRKCDCK